jgi:lipoyl(octanoyl) transferase
MLVTDLGVMAYRDAWQTQDLVHARVADGGDETLLLVQHPPVVTLGRRPDARKNLLASQEQLQRAGIDLVQSDRGGDITFHGPGQLVAYPIVRLADHRLSVAGYVHKLESIVIGALAELGISAYADPQAIGVWTRYQDAPAKICAIGVRIRRGVSMHGLALNVAADLDGFRHIVPCGLPGRPVGSIAQILGDGAPPLPAVKKILSDHILGAFATTAASGDNGQRRAL